MTARGIITTILVLAAISAAMIVEYFSLAELWFPLYCLAGAGWIATMMVLYQLGETPLANRHHAHWGLLCVVASAMLPMGSVAAVLYAIGFVMIVDDLYQHVRQLREPLYESPIHWLYVRLVRFLRRIR